MRWMPLTTKNPVNKRHCWLPLSLVSLLAAGLLVGCRAVASTTPELESSPLLTLSSTTADPLYQSEGGGEPRSAGYWLIWNSCAPDNRSETAAANGGRAAGWFIMDDLLEDPGILVGPLELRRCEEGLLLLQGQPLQGVASPEDVAYSLAAQLLTAQLNLAANAEFCPAVDDAVQSAQMLLISAGFDGQGEMLGSGAPDEDRQLAQFLTGQLANYNTGLLCR